MGSTRAIKIFPLVSILFFLTAAGVALAEGAANINVTIPGVPPAQNNPGAWVGGLYQFSLMAAGLLAFGMIVYAGLRYTFAAGNPSTQSDARDQILQALLGVLLLLGAFIVLTTINPGLVNLQLPGLTKIQGQQGGVGNSNTSNQGSGISGNTNLQPGGGQFGGGGASGNFSGLSDNQARQNLIAGIEVKPGVSLEGIQATSIDAVNNLKNSCGCNVTITAGTDGIHAGGALSHANGYKIDLRSDSSLGNYITQNFTPIGIRSDGAPQYQAPNGAIYAKESNHWDVLVKA